ncbi:MAG TPA: hypothetical protein VF650_09935 [Allosphingosinicella sp.]|jgi:hypothetical protein
MLAWLTEHGTTPEAQFVFRAWLNRGGDFEPIREQIYTWIVLWQGEPETSFVTRHLVKRHDLPEPVILAIASWAVTFRDHEDSLDRLAALIGHVHEDMMTEAGFLRLVSLAEDAIIETLDRERLSEQDRSDLWRISGSLSRNPLFSCNPQGCLRAITAIVKSERVFVRGLATNGADFLNHTYERIFNTVLNAIRWGNLSITDDRGALEVFADWLRSAGFELERLERALEK